MVKHAQTNCLSVFDHFVGLVLNGLSMNLIHYRLSWISNSPSQDKPEKNESPGIIIIN